MCANKTSGLNRYQAMDHAVDTFERAWNRLFTILKRTWDMFGMDEKVELAKQYALQHPIVTLCAVLTLCMCSIPIMCFLFFVMGSLFLTFLGFLFVEGFLLTFASVILGGVLFVVGMLSIGASSILALIWCLFSTGTNCFTTLRSKFFKSERNPGPSLFNFLSFEHTNGECVRDSCQQQNEKEQ